MIRGGGRGAGREWGGAEEKDQREGELEEKEEGAEEEDSGGGEIGG